MNKRKSRAFVSTLVVIAVIGRASIFMFNFSGGFVLKNEHIIAGQLDVIKAFSLENDPENEIDAAVQYFGENGINTAIVTLNSGNKSIAELPGYDYIYINNESLTKADIIEKLGKALTKEKIQLYISVDCAELSDESILSTVEYIYDNYKFAGIVIDNFGGEDVLLNKIREVLDSRGRKLNFILQADDVQQIRNIAQIGIADGFISENIDARAYFELKSEIDENILLHYSSPSMESDVFLLSNFSSVDGAVVTDFDKSNITPYQLNSIFYNNENLPSFNFTVSTDFNVTYPAKDMATYYKGLYITGTGEPYGTVTVNGNDYKAEKDGTFGIYTELDEGENTLEISQNGETVSFEITRKVYKSTGVKYELPWDDTETVNYGQIVRTTNELTSMLSDPDYDSAVIAGMEKGTKLKIVGVEETTRNSQKTYAYRLSNGAYVLAGNVEILDEVAEGFEYDSDEDTDFDTSELELYEEPVISSALIERLDNGDELLQISVNNMPAVISDFGEESLTLHFLDTEIKDFDFPKSSFYTDYRVYRKEDGTYIEFRFNTENRLWGYDVSVNESYAAVYLKQAPELQAGDKPLKDITIMLDAGHGGADSGALGVASVHGPLEKDVNLAVAQATKALLEQYGAQVVMTRNDDSFPTLDDRRNMVRSVKPDLFIAVHHNSMDYSYNSTNAVGSECYYFTKQSKQLADLLCENITNATGRRNRGSNVGYFYVTRTDIAPSVLMEYSFIINPKDYSSTYSDTDIYKAAFGTLQAVLKAIPT